MNRETVGVVEAFFLQYAFHGYPAVDHIDIQTGAGNYITFVADGCVPPMTKEMTRHKLRER